MANDDCRTPDEFYKQLDQVFHFKLDAAASKSNTKCKHYFIKKDNALKIPWTCSGWVWLNPPYSREAGGITKWLGKAYTEVVVKGHCYGVVCLTICDVSTATRDFAWYNADEIVELCPRINFASPGKGKRTGGFQAYQLVIFTQEERLRRMSRWNWKLDTFKQRDCFNLEKVIYEY